MIKIFYGDNRVEAQREIRRYLGDQYEVLEGAELTEGDLPAIFLGASLFTAQKRKIVIKDLSPNKPVWQALIKFLHTEHEVVIWEQKLDQRTAATKALVKAGVEICAFQDKSGPDPRKVFDILDAAWHDGKKAVEMLADFQQTEVPQRLIGALATSATRRFARNPNRKARLVLKELAKLDMQLKSGVSTQEAWLLMEATLLRLEYLK